MSKKSQKGSVYIYTMFLMFISFSLILVLLRVSNLNLAMAVGAQNQLAQRTLAYSGIDRAVYYLNANLNRNALAILVENYLHNMHIPYFYGYYELDEDLVTQILNYHFFVPDFNFTHSFADQTAYVSINVTDKIIINSTVANIHLRAYARIIHQVEITAHNGDYITFSMAGNVGVAIVTLYEIFPI